MDTFTGSSETDLLDKIRHHVVRAAEQPEATSSTARSTALGGGAVRAVSTAGDEDKNNNDGNDRSLDAARVLIEAVSTHVDVARLLRDIRTHAGVFVSSEAPATTPPAQTATANKSLTDAAATPLASSSTARVERGTVLTKTGAGERVKVEAGHNAGGVISQGEDESRSPVQQRKSREEVEAEASKQGASGG